MQLTWTHQADAECYNVYRSTSPSVQAVASNRIEACHVTNYATYLDNTTVNGITYYYRVTKVVGGKEVCISNEVMALPATR